MRVAYVSHSLCADRQALFAAELRRQLEAAGGALFEGYPAKWGSHERAGGFGCTFEGDFLRYDLDRVFWSDLAAFKPDIVLIQQEAYCFITVKLAGWCLSKGVPYVTFSWENAAPPQGPAVSVLSGAAARVCGNEKAAEFAARAPGKVLSCVLPQVGFDETIFRPVEVEHQWDVLFKGRGSDPMKGLDVLKAAVEGKPWRVEWQAPRVDYDKLPYQYCAASVLCVPSRDVPGHAREQFAPAVTVEALLCGVPVVTTTQEAIFEWTRGCNVTEHVEPDNPAALRHGIERVRAMAAAEPAWWSEQRAHARRCAIGRFSNKAVAAQYVEVFGSVLG